MTEAKKNEGRLSEQQMRDKKLKVLRVLAAAREPISIGEIARRIESEPATTVRALIKDQLVQMIGVVTGKDRQASRYRYKLTYFGEIAANKNPDVKSAITAQRRTHSHLTGEYTYTGFQVPYRRGSFDHEKIPSLVQGETLPYSPPRSILTGKTEAYEDGQTEEEVSEEITDDQ